MELRDFIKNTLIDILGGIQDASDTINQNVTAKGAVNPLIEDNIFNTQMVQFDIAVTASNELSKGAKGGIQVYALNLGAEGKTAQSESTVSRLQFSIPVALPASVIKTQG